jgi:hypothetical protein
MKIIKMLMFPENPIYPYPKEIISGFVKFCEDINCKAEIIGKIYPDMDFRKEMPT